MVSGINDGKTFYLRFVGTGDSRFASADRRSPGFDRIAIAMAASMRLAGAQRLRRGQRIPAPPVCQAGGGPRLGHGAPPDCQSTRGAGG